MRESGVDCKQALMGGSHEICRRYTQVPCTVSAKHFIKLNADISTVLSAWLESTYSEYAMQALELKELASRHRVALDNFTHLISLFYLSYVGGLDSF
jgi:hypothetical protein